MARLLSINVGRPKEADWAGIGATAIDKQPVTGPVALTELGVAGDQVADTVHHGGLEQAVSAYAREDLAFWEAQLGVPIRDGQFGENLTTEGIDLNQAQVGTRLRIGDATLEICSVRTPCNDFKHWMGLSGFDNTVWVKRFATARRPGPYLRVVETGTLTAGDAVEVVHEPSHGVTVEVLFVALNFDHSRLPELLAIDDLAPKVRRRVDEYLGGQRVPYRQGQE